MGRNGASSEQSLIVDVALFRQGSAAVAHFDASAVDRNGLFTASDHTSSIGLSMMKSATSQIAVSNFDYPVHERVKLREFEVTLRSLSVLTLPRRGSAWDLGTD